MFVFFFFSSRRRHTRWNCDWSSDVCSSDLLPHVRWLDHVVVDADDLRQLTHERQLPRYPFEKPDVSVSSAQNALRKPLDEIAALGGPAADEVVEVSRLPGFDHALDAVE